MAFSLAALISELRQHEPQITRHESADVGRHQWDVRCAHTKPLRKGRRILIDRRGGNPADLIARVVRAAKLNGRLLTVTLAALYRAAQNEVVIAPRVVGALLVVGERAAEVRCSKLRYFGRGAEFDGRLVEGVQPFTEITQQHGMIDVLIAVGIESAQADKENLSLDPEQIANADQVRGHL